ncbi:dodecin family protein [Chlamydiota bacterium]
MFKMIEVIGSSEKGYSDAVKNAIKSIIDSGESVHFFEVSEQRGSVRNGKFNEFQVKLKVAIDINEKRHNLDNQKKHVCLTCLQPVQQEGHLCVPTTQIDEKCDWCGALIPDGRHLCNDKIKELSFICNTCGRTAVEAKYLCNPQKIT